MDKRIVLLAFVVTGFTAMVYEIAWSRPLHIIFGSGIYSASVIQASLLGGFSLGSFLYGKKADSMRKPMGTFGAIQVVLGIYGTLLVGVLYSLSTSSASFGASFTVLDVAFCFLLLILPAALMGASWPLANKAYVDNEKDPGILYSANSVGSFFGPLSAGFVMIPLVGVTYTVLLASVISILVGSFFIIKEGVKDGFW